MDRDGWVDQRILAAVTRRGRRLLTYDELIDAGIAAREITGRVTRGSLQRIHGRIYLVGAGELSWQEDILAGALAGGETAAASHFSAARLWGLGEFGGPVHVTISVETTLSATGVRVHRTKRQIPTSTVGGVPCVCVEEALLGIAGRLPERAVHQSLTNAWRRGLTTPKRVLAYVDDLGGPGVKGTRRLRPVASLYVHHKRAPGSDAESGFLFDFRAALEVNGIEEPVLQMPIELDPVTGVKATPDSVWPARWKVIEMMGLEAHGNYEVQADDVERADAIRAAGWDLAEVTPRQMNERREKTIARLIRFLQTPNAHWPPDPPPFLH